MEMSPEERHTLAKHLEATQGYLGLGMAMEAWNELESIDARHRQLAEVLTARVEICRAMEKWEMMVEICRFLAQGEPNAASHVLNLAYAVRRHESVESAAALLETARRRFPQDAFIVYNLACYRSVVGRIDEAKDLLRAAFELDQDLRSLALEDTDLEPMWADI